MHRRSFIASLAALLGGPTAAAGFVGFSNRGARSARTVPGLDSERPARGRPPDWEPLELSREEWREVLTAREFDILRDEDTEPAGSSPLNRETRDGTFICAGCFLPLFSSDDKFMSGTGWPSFTRPIEDENIATKRDFLLLIPRTEYHCARCGGHQGHVFDDGPEPTGKRWCNNGLALDFVPRGQPLPELRT